MRVTCTVISITRPQPASVTAETRPLLTTICRSKSYNVSFGLQYTQPFNKDNSLTIGLVYGLGHNMNSTEVKGIQVAADNTSSSTSDSYNVVNERENITDTAFRILSVPD